MGKTHARFEEGQGRNRECANMLLEKARVVREVIKEVESGTKGHCVCW